jgi:hypothetical protein
MGIYPFSLTSRSRGMNSALQSKLFETSPHLQTGRDGLADIRERLIPGISLANTTGNGRTFGNPDTVFIPIQRGDKFHNEPLLRFPDFGKPRVADSQNPEPFHQRFLSELKDHLQLRSNEQAVRDRP